MRAGGFKRWECVFFSLFLCIPSVSSVSSSVDSLSNRWKGGKPRRVQCCCCCCCCFCRRFFYIFYFFFRWPSRFLFLSFCFSMFFSRFFFVLFQSSQFQKRNEWLANGRGFKKWNKEKTHTHTHTHTADTQRRVRRDVGSGRWMNEAENEALKERKKEVSKKKKKPSHTHKKVATKEDRKEGSDEWMDASSVEQLARTLVGFFRPRLDDQQRLAFQETWGAENKLS